MNHLVGPGTTSSRLTTSARLTIGQIDVSVVLMNARTKVIKHQSEISDISDLLTLNFIFNSEFMKRNLPPNVLSLIPQVSVPATMPEELGVLNDCSLFASNHTFLETNQFAWGLSSGTLIEEILRSFTSRSNLWKSCSEANLQSNEDTYIQHAIKHIIIGILGDLDVNDHWTRDKLPTPRGYEEQYFTDYFAEVSGLPFFVVEVKKPEVEDEDVLSEDKRKLPSMMKLMLDQLLKAGVIDATVVSFLFAGMYSDNDDKVESSDY
ncbi:hypothetical protein BGZ76_002597 [Entomortierella beljakovae]|nr:hypothetical protein BGZ76_002597 [Entomortierella beljakovae]